MKMLLAVTLFLSLFCLIGALINLQYDETQREAMAYLAVSGAFSLFGLVSARGILVRQIVYLVIISYLTLFVVHSNPATRKRVAALTLKAEKEYGMEVPALKRFLRLPDTPINENSLFDLAITNLDKATFWAITHSGLDLEKRGDHGRSILHHLVLQKLHSQFASLLRAGVSVDPQDNFGESPIFYAIRAGDLVLVDNLLIWNAKINLRNAQGETPLFLAIKNNMQLVVDMLLLRHANPNGQTPQVNKGDTYLHFAAKRHFPGIVASLLQHGAEVNATNNQGETALHTALQAERIEAINSDVLLKILSYGADLSIPDREGILPLEKARPRGNNNVLAAFSIALQCQIATETHAKLATVL